MITVEKLWQKINVMTKKNCNESLIKVIVKTLNEVVIKLKKS